MQKKFTELSFIIGSFFIIVAVILFFNHMLTTADANNMALYAAIAFFIFGAFMIFITPSKTKS